MCVRVSDLEIRQIGYSAPAARTLVEGAMADLRQRYGGPGDDAPVEAVEFEPPAGCFLVAWLHGEPVACGGWRTLSHLSGAGGPDGVAEIKRMYAVPGVRGTGVAVALLQAVEASAREHGMRRIVLETGDENPEAIAFYARNGYGRISNYGFYKDEPDCVSFGRDL